MKKCFAFILLLLMVLAGCNNPLLTRIDVYKVGDTESEEIIISDNKELTAIESVFGEIIWEPNTKASMERNEDVKAVFFIQKEKNMPEKLTEYKIWFDGSSATFISSNPEESYGRLLDKKKSSYLKSKFLD